MQMFNGAFVVALCVCTRGASFFISLTFGIFFEGPPEDSAARLPADALERVNLDMRANTIEGFEFRIGT